MLEKAVKHVALSWELRELAIVRHDDRLVQALERALPWRVAVVAVTVGIVPALQCARRKQGREREREEERERERERER